MIKWFFLLLPTFLMCACGSAMSKDGHRINSIIQRHSGLMKRENNLVLIGSGSSFPDSIHGFILDYIAYKKLDIQQARIIFVKSTQHLLDMINSDQVIRPKLANYPFTEDNLEFRLSFLDNKGRYFEPPNVAYISIIDGKIYYSFYDNQKDRFIDEMDFVEPYSEALRIVQEEETSVGRMLN